MFGRILHHPYLMLCSRCNIITKTDSFEQVTTVLPDDGAVCAETWRDLINNIYIYIYIYSTVCVLSLYIKDIILTK